MCEGSRFPTDIVAQVAAEAWIPSVPWELPYVAGVAIKRKGEKKKKETSLPAIKTCYKPTIIL